ncbi:MAG: helix-turn-helix transcriptional regulator, partial [Prevotella sp.]|nr:helix-turn-helix transcriptional regulator [Prevotella sp.]
IRLARLQQNMSQQQLGDRIGVKRAQISKIETGGNITLRTYSRVFKALGIATASIDLGGSIGRVALW